MKVERGDYLVCRHGKYMPNALLSAGEMAQCGDSHSDRVETATLPFKNHWEFREQRVDAEPLLRASGMHVACRNPMG